MDKKHDRTCPTNVRGGIQQVLQKFGRRKDIGKIVVMWVDFDFVSPSRVNRPKTIKE